MAQHIYEITSNLFKNYSSEISKTNLESPMSNPFNLKDLEITFGMDWDWNKTYQCNISDLQLVPTYLFHLAGTGSHLTEYANRHDFIRVGGNFSRIHEIGGIHNMSSAQVNLYSKFNNAQYDNLGHCLAMWDIYRKNPVRFLTNNPLDHVDEIVNSIGTTPSRFWSVFENGGNRGTYLDVHWAIGNHNLAFRNFKFKNFNVAVRHGCIVDVDNGKVLASINVKSEWLEYFVLRRLQNGATATNPINPAIFTVLVDEGFYNGEGPYSKELLSLVKKGLINLLPEGIDVQIGNGKEQFNKLFSNRYPTKKTQLGPLEEIEHNAVLQEDMFEHTVAHIELNDANIYVVD